MRNFHFLLLTLCPFVSYAIHDLHSLVPDSSQYVYFFDDVQLSPEEFMNYRPADHSRIRGRRLGWWRTLILKKTQKALRQQSGSFNAKQVNEQLSLTTAKYHKSSFYLATLFPLIGLFYALFSGKRNRIRAALWGAWLGLAVRLLVVAALLLLMLGLIDFFATHTGP